MLFSYQPQYEGKDLPSWQTAIIGLISGACGPFTNGKHHFYLGYAGSSLGPNHVLRRISETSKAEN
jgi:hypothetical protein